MEFKAAATTLKLPAQKAQPASKTFEGSSFPPHATARAGARGHVPRRTLVNDGHVKGRPVSAKAKVPAETRSRSNSRGDDATNKNVESDAMVASQFQQQRMKIGSPKINGNRSRSNSRTLELGSDKGAASKNGNSGQPTLQWFSPSPREQKSKGGNVAFLAPSVASKNQYVGGCEFSQPLDGYSSAANDVALDGGVGRDRAGIYKRTSAHIRIKRSSMTEKRSVFQSCHLSLVKIL